MIVVVPEAHAFDVDASYDKNQAAVDEELFRHIIPFLIAKYCFCLRDPLNSLWLASC